MLGPPPDREFDTNIKILPFCLITNKLRWSLSHCFIKAASASDHAWTWLAFLVFSPGGTTERLSSSLAGLWSIPERNKLDSAMTESPVAQLGSWPKGHFTLHQNLKEAFHVLLSEGRGLAGPKAHICPSASPICNSSDAPHLSHPKAGPFKKARRWGLQQDSSQRFQLWLPDLLPHTKVGSLFIPLSLGPQFSYLHINPLCFKKFAKKTQKPKCNSTTKKQFLQTSGPEIHFY